MRLSRVGDIRATAAVLGSTVVRLCLLGTARRMERIVHHYADLPEHLVTWLNLSNREGEIVHET
ncbi:MAG: hypothetical protein L0Z68_06085 [Gammaproteobacteria bacterium]|nr:hypothetical protein [Gammaproteobacteria bacterium]